MIRPLAIIEADFLAVGQVGAPRGWGNMADYAECQPITALPIADTELLNISHYAPIGIILPDQEGRPPLVALLLHPQCTRPRLFTQGRWEAPYRPIGLRILPFTPGTNGACLISPMLANAPGGTTWKIEAKPGVISPEYKQVLDLVKLLAGGAQRLSEAARFLISADLLVPIEPLEAYPALRIMTVSEQRMLDLDPVRAAGLTALQMLPLELASAILFSRRHLKRRIVRDVSVSSEMMPLVPQGASDPILSNVLPQQFGLDTSSLFSLEDFIVSEENSR